MKVRDDVRTVLAETPFSWELDRSYELALRVKGSTIVGTVEGTVLTATDAGPQAYEDGGIGLVIDSGALSTDAVSVEPAAR